MPRRTYECNSETISIENCHIHWNCRNLTALLAAKHNSIDVPQLRRFIKYPRGLQKSTTLSILEAYMVSKDRNTGFSKYNYDTKFHCQIIGWQSRIIQTIIYSWTWWWWRQDNAWLWLILMLTYPYSAQSLSWQREVTPSNLRQRLVPAGHMGQIHNLHILSRYKKL